MIRIDNTQYSAYMKCPAYWVEKYVHKIHRPYTGQRDDALAVGIAVHDALFQGYKHGNFDVDKAVMAELNLTYEAQLEVRSMVEAYRAAYPGGPVELPWIGLEEPLDMPITDCNVTLTAKVDGLVDVKDGIEISAWNGSIYLPDGIYTFETKTKRSGFDRGLYIAEWQAAMQASFQLLTARHNAIKIGLDPDRVRGVIVNVIERPRVYEPRRTCQSCEKINQVRLYTLIGKQYQCPECGYLQQFRGSIGQARVDPPYMWRFMVERSPERLQHDLETILQVADNMFLSKFNAENTDHIQPIHNRTQCVNIQWKQRCEYFEPHNALIPVTAIDWPGFETFNPTAYLETNNVES